MNEMERNLRAAKYSARVAIERQREEQKMDRAVLRLLKGSALFFLWAVILAVLV